MTGNGKRLELRCCSQFSESPGLYNRQTTDALPARPSPHLWEGLFGVPMGVPGRSEICCGSGYVYEPCSKVK